MTVAPCRVPTLEFGRLGLEFWNAAVSHSDRTIPIENSAATLSFRVVKGPPPDRSGYRIETSCGTGLLLHFVEVPFSEWFGVDLHYPDIEKLSPGLRDAIDQGLLDFIRQQLPEELPSTIRSVSRRNSPDLFRDIDRRSLSWLEVDFCGAGAAPIKCSVGLHPGQLISVIGGAEIGRHGVRRQLASRIDCRLSYSIGSVQLSAGTVSELAPGDLVVLDANASDSVLFVTGAAGRFVFNKSDENWICERTRMDSGLESSALEELPQTTQAGPIPVTLDFDIGHLNMTVSELQNWQPGTIVALDPPQLSEDIEVKIRANGHLLGVGDLVRIDDRIAVRISDIRNSELPGDGPD